MAWYLVKHRDNYLYLNIYRASNVSGVARIVVRCSKQHTNCCWYS